MIKFYRQTKKSHNEAIIMIISLKKQITQLFNPVILNQQAKACGFIQRVRAVKPTQLLASLVNAMSLGHTHSIADLHRQFNGIQLSETHFVFYKPFHNQLRKPGFPQFIACITRHAMALMVRQCAAELPEKLRRFSQILLHDGTSFAVHPALRQTFPGRFSRTSPAAVECHVTLSLHEQTLLDVTITPDTATERDYLPPVTSMKGKLILADAGYVDKGWFAAVDQQGGYYLVRGSQSLNPVVLSAQNLRGRKCPKLSGKKLKEIDRKTNRSEVLDMDVAWGKQCCRLLRRWHAPEKRFVIWLTNSPREEYHAEEVMQLYRCRWQIELLFKELKSNTCLKKYQTEQPAIMEGLIWSSLLAVTLRRLIGMTLYPGLSLQKAAKNNDVWFSPIMEAVSHGARQEISEHLEWAATYLRNNAVPTERGKLSKSNGLRDILSLFNA